MLESNGIMGFVDGSNPCPAITVSAESGINSCDSSTSVECDELLVWKMHDRAVMLLFTVTLYSVAISCVIGSTGAINLWVCLHERFSTVSKTSIFQLKSDLQTIKKWADSVTQYLQWIKEARLS